jgi:glycosyltransferase involved in cell wall biosynthesis
MNRHPGQSPRITIVTPSFQQGRFLSQTIESVLGQGYGNLQYMVLDGGSTDGSPEIIRRFERHIAYWHSRPDRGQADALVQGFAQADGDILAWINSDDFLIDGCLHRVAEAWRAAQEAAAWVGTCRNVDVAGNLVDDTVPRVGDAPAFARWGAADGAWLGQPACFFSRRAYAACHGLRTDLHFVFDVDLWIRLAKEGPFAVIDQALGCNRMYAQTKTNAYPVRREIEHMGMLAGHGFWKEAQDRLIIAHREAMADPAWADAVLDTFRYSRLLKNIAGRISRKVL